MYVYNIHSGLRERERYKCLCMYIYILYVYMYTCIIHTDLVPLAGIAIGRAEHGRQGVAQGVRDCQEVVVTEFALAIHLRRAQKSQKRPGVEAKETLSYVCSCGEKERDRQKRKFLFKVDSFTR